MFTKTNLIFYTLTAFYFCYTVNASSENLFGDEKYTGKLATVDQFPYVIRLYSKVRHSSITYCTAAIITYSKLLTAGHCCHNKGFRFVVSGDPDQTDFVFAKNKTKYVVSFVKKVIVHPQFERTPAKLVHDLCLLILEEPVNPRDGHQTIEVSYEKLAGKKICTALGWGTNFGYEIQHKLYYKQAIGYRCNVRFGNSSKYWFVCLEPHSVCPGDSGGPLICDGKLYGIASFFIGGGDDPNPRCEEGVVDYYSELVAERDFIETNSDTSQQRSIYVMMYTFMVLYFYTENY